jgi:hypothetical protein
VVEATHCENDEGVLHVKVPGVHGPGRTVDIGEAEDEDEDDVVVVVVGLVGVEIELVDGSVVLVSGVVVDVVGVVDMVVKRVVKVGDAVNDAESVVEVVTGSEDIVVEVVIISDMVVEVVMDSDVVVKMVVKLVGSVVVVVVVVIIVEVVKSKVETLLVVLLSGLPVSDVDGKGKTVTVMVGRGREALLLMLVLVDMVLESFGKNIPGEPVIVVELSKDEGKLVVDAAAGSPVAVPRRVVERYSLVITAVVVDDSRSEVLSSEVVAGNVVEVSAELLGLVLALSDDVDAADVEARPEVVRLLVDREDSRLEAVVVDIAES